MNMVVDLISFILTRFLAHLNIETRELIVQQLNSNNGFNSKRRSFARNNLVAVTIYFLNL